MKKPIVNKLDWYIIRKFIGTFLFTILIVVLVIIIFDLSEKIDYFVENEVALKEIVFDYYCSFIPWMLNSFGPLFVFVAAIFFTSQMASHSEIVAILSSGVSYKRLLAPYMMSAAVIATFYLLMGMFVIPPADRTRIDFEDKYIKAHKTASSERDIHYQIAPGEFVYVEQFSPWANTAYRFTLETIDGDNVKSKLSAESAVWDTTFNGWKLRNWIERAYYGESEILKYGRYRDTVINLTVEDFYRRDNIVETLTQKQLNDLIDMQGMRGDEMIRYSLIEKNNRIATPFSAFILTVMAVSLSSRKKRGGIGINVGVGLALSFSYILFQRFSQMFVFTGTLSPAVAMWLPNILYAGIAVILYLLAQK